MELSKADYLTGAGPIRLRPDSNKRLRPQAFTSGLYQRRENSPRVELELNGAPECVLLGSTARGSGYELALYDSQDGTRSPSPR